MSKGGVQVNDEAPVGSDLEQAKKWMRGRRYVSIGKRPAASMLYKDELEGRDSHSIVTFTHRKFVLFVSSRVVIVYLVFLRWKTVCTCVLAASASRKRRLTD